MKPSIAPLAIAGALLFLAVASTPIAVGQNGDRIVVPDSSVVHPEDLGVRAHTNIILVLLDKSELGDGPPVAENPLSLACIYDLVTRTKGCPQTSKILPTGGTKAIALVEAYDNPDASTDITTFATAYGYGTPNLTVVKVGNPSANAGWALEESLAIEYSFGQAPNAQIYLVEANSNSFSDLLAAEDKATELLQAAGGGEASNSWGAVEFSGETAYDKHFKGKGVVYFAAAGGSGGQIDYPSASPDVISAGGTQIVRDSKGNFLYEEDMGEFGDSLYEPRPSYQNIIKKIVGTHRGTPDISSDASAVSYVAVYSQYGCGGWCVVGGTSVSSPTLAGIVNAAGEFNTSTYAELTETYKEYGNSKEYKADFTDITRGGKGYGCKKDWDFCTGIGSPLTLNGK